MIHDIYGLQNAGKVTIMKLIMQRIIFILVIFLVVSAASVKSVMAATLKLNKIGESTTEGQTFRSWVYQGLNPVFQGVTTPDAQVSITLNSANNKVTADAAGDWSFQPTTLIAGQHEVTIGSDGEEIAFTLTIDDGSSSSATQNSTASSAVTSTNSAVVADKGIGGASSSTTTEELPVSGAVSQTMLLIVAGFSVIGLGLTIRSLHHAEIEQ